MRVFLKTLCLMLCLCTVAAALSACFDKTVDFTVESDSTAVTGENTDAIGGGIGGGSLDSGSAKPFFDPSWTVKNGITYYYGDILLLRSAFDPDGRLVAEVYTDMHLFNYEYDMYITYSYGSDGLLEELVTLDYKLCEEMRIKFESVGDRQLRAVSVYEGYELSDIYSVTAEHHENGMLKSWHVECEDYTYAVEYDGLGRRVAEECMGDRFEPTYDGDSFEIVSATVDGADFAEMEYTDGFLTYITDGEDHVEFGYDANGNPIKMVWSETSLGGTEPYLVAEAKYNSASRPTKITMSQREEDKWIMGAEVGFTYDGAGRVVTVLKTQYSRSGTAQTTVQTEFKYNPNGSVSREKVTQTNYGSSGPRTEIHETFYTVDGVYDRTEYYENDTTETEANGGWDSEADKVETTQRAPEDTNGGW